ncbi:MAG: ABC transporter ATP-binding protein [SAR202 cluster bacterium]|nr:ABC transporter ATP-binding protein [SAR202 cluster bacterium]|tara:strand:- start:11747 stop:12481 length:735 start_codon:yes stop_codon:yes gene_type:complete
MSNTNNNVGFAIEAKRLRKSFGSNLVLNELDMSVDWGSFTVIFGSNGSGKSTLVNNLATISTPTSGEIYVAGFDIKKEKALIRKNIGVVTHELLLYSDLTAYENLFFYGKMFNLPDIEHKIELTAEITGAKDYLRKKIKHMSHGMQKRIAIGRAILHDPPILFLDEPESGLDQEALERLYEMIRSGQNGKRTILMTTHNIDRGLEMGDRVTVLSKGKISYDKKRVDINRDVFEGDYISLRQSQL